ncbi:MAG: hypothetical protein LWW85_06735, partial [Marinilabiliales bacterium]|nr:hypothetical protein [Marinilabiliales bacterium]
MAHQKKAGPCENRPAFFLPFPAGSAAAEAAATESPEVTPRGPSATGEVIPGTAATATATTEHAQKP